MLYLLDSNVLMQAHEEYYPVDRIPQFWKWLIVEATEGHIKMPVEIYEEIKDPEGLLGDWGRRAETKEALILRETISPILLDRVLEDAYGHQLTRKEKKQTGQDPYLIGYALMGKDRTVVTKERSKTTLTRGRTRVPDACDKMDVRWMDDFKLYEERHFAIPE